MRAAASQYVALVAAQDRLAIRIADLALAEDLARQAQALVQAGTTDPISGTRAETEIAAARSAVQRAMGDVQRVQIELARLLDLPPGMPLKAQQTLSVHLVPEAPQAHSTLEAVAFALANRSEIAVSSALSAQQAAIVASERGVFHLELKLLAKRATVDFLMKKKILAGRLANSPCRCIMMVGIDEPQRSTENDNNGAASPAVNPRCRSASTSHAHRYPHGGS